MDKRTRVLAAMNGGWIMFQLDFGFILAGMKLWVRLV